MSWHWSVWGEGSLGSPSRGTGKSTCRDRLTRAPAPLSDAYFAVSEGVATSRKLFQLAGPTCGGPKTKIPLREDSENREHARVHGSESPRKGTILLHGFPTASPIKWRWLIIAKYHICLSSYFSPSMMRYSKIINLHHRVFLPINRSAIRTPVRP